MVHRQISPRMININMSYYNRNHLDGLRGSFLHCGGNSGRYPTQFGALQPSTRPLGTRMYASMDDDHPMESTTADPQTAEYSLNFLWLDKNLAVSVDQVFGRGHRSPITEYFFWPREDAWEKLKSALEEKDWISHQDKVALLNTCTEVINYWQDEERPSVQDAIAKYPHCCFQG